MRLLQVVVALAVLAVAGLSAYAYFGDMTPERREMRVPVSLTGEPLPEAPPAGTSEADTSAAAEPDDGPDDGPQQSETSTAAEAPAAGANGLD